MAAEPARPTSTRLAHLPALDGLRAVAVMAVILYHSDVSWMPGGFLGVDLFFVLSGYLITTLLLREREATGRIDLRAFWIRRFRRLVPALLLVLFAIALYIHFAADASSRHSLSWDGLATLGYFANWRFIVMKQSYFAAFGPPSPLKHMWSLAVEEQWYLIWPLLFGGLLTLFAGRRRAVLGTVLVLAACSMIAMRILTPRVGDPGRAYYGTDARAHTLLIGSALAVLMHHRSIRSHLGNVAVQIAGASGLLFVVYSFLHFNDGDRFLYRNGGFALFAVAGAAVIVAAIHPVAGPVQRLLRPRPMQFIGRISYGLYLWHWPVDIYLTGDRVGLGGFSLFVCQLSATFGLALLSYKFVELPIRRGETWSPKAMSVSGATAGCMAAVLLVSSAGSSAVAGVPGAGPRPARQVVIVSKTVPATTSPVHSLPIEPDAPPPTPANRDVHVEVVGDSVGYSLVNDGPHVVGMTISSDGVTLGCGAMPSDYWLDREIISGGTAGDHCRQEADRWRLAGKHAPDLVLVTLGTWELYDHEIDGRRYNVGTSAYRRVLLAALENDLAQLNTVRKPRVAMFNVACSRPIDRVKGAPRTDPRRVRWVNGVFKEFASRHRHQIQLIDFASFVCPNGKPLDKINGIKLRIDGTHFTPKSSPFLWRWLAPQLLDLAHRRAV